MLTIDNTNPADFIKVDTSINNIPYIVRADSLILFNVNESFMTTFLTKFDFSKVTTILIHQLDKYEDLTSFKKGLKLLIDYIIFDNQAFISTFNIINTTQSFYDATNETFEANKKKISSTGEYFPKTSMNFLLAITERMRGSFLPYGDASLTGLIDTQQASENIEIQKETLTDIDPVSGLPMERWTYIQHNIVKFLHTMSRNLFVGTCTINMQAGSIVFNIDIHNIIKVETVTPTPPPTTP